MSNTLTGTKKCVAEVFLFFELEFSTFGVLNVSTDKNPKDWVNTFWHCAVGSSLLKSVHVFYIHPVFLPIARKFQDTGEIA